MADYNDNFDAEQWQPRTASSRDAAAQGGYGQRQTVQGYDQQGAARGYGQQGGYPQQGGYGQAPQGAYAQGAARGYGQGQQGMPRNAQAGGQSFGERVTYGQPASRQPGRPGYPQNAQAAQRGGYAQNPQAAARAGYAQGRGGYPQQGGYGQAPQGGYPQQGRSGYPQNAQAAARGGYAAAQGARTRNGNPNVQLVDGNGQRRYGRTSNANAYTKEYGTSKGKVAKYVVLGIIALVIALLGFGIFKVVKLFTNMQGNGLTDQDADNLASVLAEAKATEPFYMLLLGTDSDAVRTGDGYEGNLTDTMMLVRVDPQLGKITIISLLRDTYVNTGQWDDATWNLVYDRFRAYIDPGDEIKLNSAYKYGGPALAVACVKQLTGIEVSHYASVDMDGFVSLVDAVGGIEVNVPISLYDSQLGYSIDAGWQVLDGEAALALCRMRYAYEAIEREQGLAGDVYRAANQRMVISALMKKVLSSDVSTLMASVTKLSSFVTIDSNFTVTELAQLATAFRNIDTATDIYSTRLPTTGGYVREADWKVMVTRMEQGMSPVTEDVVDAKTGTILQSAGTGDIDDLNGIDSNYKDESDQGDGTQATQ